MALGIRGSNPIWLEVDLQGKLFDDTFYLFVLENEIPYIPASVYQDPDLTTLWTNPIQFLGNGTLPIDIYFETDTVYRLEFRQGPTQAYPLIYEVDNYVPGAGGSTPVDTIAFSSENQITNPQFALTSLQNPVTIAGTNPAKIEIAPGWFLAVAGTGSVTISIVALDNTNINPSNAPYALQLNMSGWTDESVILSQRFFQNGMLWADKIVSTSITAKINGSPQSITANLIDSNDSVLGNVLPLTPINEDWNEYTGYAQLPDTTNPDVPPAAYIDYELLLPSNIDIYLTSFQIVVQDLPIQPSFVQDSINRQIDHTYNRAYPIVPIGAIIDFAGIVVPQHYYLCDGSAKNRVSDYLLFNAITTTETVTLTNGVNTFTVANGAIYYFGMPVEGTGIPPSTTISNITGNTITISQNATSTGASLVRFYAWGNGDGSTTFNIPNLQSFVTAGAGGAGLGFGTDTAVGKTGGAATHTLTIGEMPSHNHPGSSIVGSASTSGITNMTAEGQPNLNYTILNIAAQGGGSAHNIVQPTTLVTKCIRYQ